MPAFVILDRDGVINEDSPNYIKSVDEWIPVPGSLQAIAKLTEAGYKVFIATNQAGIGRGKLTLVTLKKIHERMSIEIERFGGKIEDIQFCPHHPDDKCDCRKPKPGMLTNLAKTHDLDLTQGYFVGDSMKDLLAAEAAGRRHRQGDGAGLVAAARCAAARADDVAEGSPLPRRRRGGRR